MKCRTQIFIVLLGLMTLFLTQSCVAANIGSGEFFAKQVMPLNQPHYAILQQSGEYAQDGAPVLEPYTKDPKIHEQVSELFEHSFMKQSIYLYYLAQNYVSHREELNEIKPAYLLLSEKDGGFAKRGFMLRQNGQLIDHTSTFYIDLFKTDTRTENWIASMTQIFPHEMGHVLYYLLSQGKSSVRSTDIHYSALTTDYRLAFDEGFAEHFERAARENEPDPVRKEQIKQDASGIQQKLENNMNGFDRDFDWPFRMGFYRAAMPFWYQSFENVRRDYDIGSGNMKYAASTKENLSVKDAIQYRNAAIHLDETKLRNPASMLATEGVIATFFDRVMRSELQEGYVEPSFYNAFLRKGESLSVQPEQVFSSMHNQYMKIFAVLHRYVHLDQTQVSQMIDFVKGYGELFPDEKSRIEQLFYEVTGGATGGAQNLGERVGPEIWLTAQEADYPYWVMDQYHGLKSSNYSFNLNAADVFDLMMIPGMKRSEAEKVVEARQSRGYFKSLDDLKNVEDISLDTVKIIQDSRMTGQGVNSIEHEQIAASYAWKPLLAAFLHLLLVGSILFAVFFIVYYVLFRRSWREKQVSILSKGLKKLLKVYAIIAVGLLSVMLGNTPYVTFLLFMAAFYAIEMLLLFFFRRRNRMLDGTLTTVAIGLAVLYSTL